MNAPSASNPYMEAIQQQNNLHSLNQTIRSKECKFSYASVSYKEFASNCPNTGWEGRKAVAIPRALFSALIKTIYHLFKAAFIGTANYLFDDGKYMKTHFFCIARDLQEAFGWLAALIKDKYGQYHIQESQFHQLCYARILDTDLTGIYEPELLAEKNEGGKKEDSFTPQLPNSEPLPIEGSPVEKTSPPDEMKVSTTSAVRESVENSSIGTNENELDLIESLIDIDAKDRRLASLSERYLGEGQLGQALSISGKISNAIEKKESLFVLIAEQYLQQGDAEKALSAIKNIRSNTEAKEAFLEKLALYHFEQEALDMSLSLGKAIHRNTNAKEALMLRIANAHYAKGDLKKACISVAEIYHDKKSKYAFLVKIAQAYFSAKNESQAVETIQELIESSMHSHLLHTGRCKEYFNAIRKNWQALPTFYNELAKSCYKQAKRYFSANDPESIEKAIVERATEPATIQRLFNL